MSDFIIIELTTTETVLVSTTGPQGAAGLGFPTGGTAGQALVKNSATNFDTAWGMPGLDISSAWTKQQYYPLATLAINGDYTIDWNWNTQPEAKVTLINGHSYMLNLPSNRQPGIKTLRTYQDSTGGSALAFDPGYIIDTSLNGVGFGPNSFVDLYVKDDGTNIVVFGAEYGI
jgi:hypothetical protein